MDSRRAETPRATVMPYTARHPRDARDEGEVQMDRDVIISRRRFLQSLAAVGVIAACGPGTPGASPAGGSPTSAAAKPVSIEWWRRNYTPGSQNAETVTSDAAVKAFRERSPNVSIAIQGGPFGPETDQKF